MFTEKKRNRNKAFAALIGGSKKTKKTKRTVAAPISKFLKRPKVQIPEFEWEPFDPSGRPVRRRASLDDNWVVSRRPKKLGSVLGNREAAMRALEYLDLRDRTPYSSNQVAVLHGRPGSGKTSLAVLALEKRGYVTEVLYPSDCCSVREIVRKTANQKNITGSKTGMVLVNLHLWKEPFRLKEFLAELTLHRPEVAKRTQAWTDSKGPGPVKFGGREKFFSLPKGSAGPIACPVFATVTTEEADPRASRMAANAAFFSIEVSSPNDVEMGILLRRASDQAEELPEEVVDTIVETAAGDARRAYSMLKLKGENAKWMDRNILSENEASKKKMAEIFKSCKTPEQAIDKMGTDGLVPLLVHANYPCSTQEFHSMVEASDIFSQFDTLETSQIKHGSWGTREASTALAGWGVTQALRRFGGQIQAPERVLYPVPCASTARVASQAVTRAVRACMDIHWTEVMHQANVLDARDMASMFRRDRVHNGLRDQDVKLFCLEHKKSKVSINMDEVSDREVHAKVSCADLKRCNNDMSKAGRSAVDKQAAIARKGVPRRLVEAGWNTRKRALLWTKLPWDFTQ